MRYAFVLYAGEERQYKRIEYNLIDDVSKRLEYVKQHIGCEWLEVVKLPLLMSDACVLVDEEGLIKADKPELNLLASVLYGTAKHNHPIVGNALLCMVEHNGESYDTVGFDESVANHIEGLLKDLQKVQ